MSVKVENLDKVIKNIRAQADKVQAAAKVGMERGAERIADAARLFSR